MKFSLLLTILVIVSLGQTEANVCGCLLYVFKDGVREALVAQVLSFVIPDFDQQSKECNDNTVNKCETICTERVSHLTNNMDLEKQPKAELNFSEPFGQFICNKFGYNIENETIGVFAYMHCNETHVEHGVNVTAEISQTVFTGVVSQQNIICRNKKFITNTINTKGSSTETSK